MAGISDKDKTVMTAKAGGPATFESLGESLQAQLEKAQGAQAGFESFQPTAQANAEAIGSFEDRAPGEAPVGIRAQGLTTAQAISSTASKTQGNILDVISSMMNLKSKQDALEQQAFDNKRALNEEAATMIELGLVMDETTGQPRPMTDTERAEADQEKFADMSDGDAVSEITSILGTGVWLGRTGKERGARARTLLGKMDRGETLKLNEWLSQDDAGIVTTIRQLNKAWELGPGTEDDLSFGPFKGIGKNISAKAGRNPEVEFYNSQKDSMVAALKQITGDTGVLTDDDAKRIIKLIPSTTSTPEKAAKDWQALSNALEATLGVSLFDDEEAITSESSFDEEAARAEGYTQAEIDEFKKTL